MLPHGPAERQGWAGGQAPTGELVVLLTLEVWAGRCTQQAFLPVVLRCLGQTVGYHRFQLPGILVKLFQELLLLCFLS